MSGSFTRHVEASMNPQKVHGAVVGSVRQESFLEGEMWKEFARVSQMKQDHLSLSR